MEQRKKNETQEDGRSKWRRREMNREKLTELWKKDGMEKDGRSKGEKDGT